MLGRAAPLGVEFDAVVILQIEKTRDSIREVDELDFPLLMRPRSGIIVRSSFCWSFTYFIFYDIKHKASGEIADQVLYSQACHASSSCSGGAVAVADESR